MDEHPESALHYGHVGRAVYQPDTRSWTFTRSLKQPSPILSSGLTKTTIPSPLIATSRRRFIEHLPSAGHHLIPKVLPDLAAGWPSFQNDTLSRAVVNTIQRYNPQVSSLLDIGYADPALEDSRIRNRIRQPVAIAAAVTGECGNTITFRVLAEDKVELDDGPSLKIPSIGKTETAEWSRRGAPILQVSFARSLEEKPHWMAARLSNVTIIFRPRLYRRESVPQYMPEDDIAAFIAPRQNSSVDANPVVEISMAQTGGAPHADVTFNPWYPRQLGIVDNEGYWSIWEITGHPRKRKSAFVANCVKRGSLPWMDHTREPNGPQYDGWGSIEWIGDVSTILVSDRRCVMVCQIVGEENYTSHVELGLSLESEWVLDVRRSVQNTSHFFVLTTTRLLWFDIAMAEPNASGQRPPLSPRLAWRHFRDPEDTTLCLSDVVVGDNFHIVLYSRLTTLVQTFQFPTIADTQTDSEYVPVVPDTALLDLPSTCEVSPLGEIFNTPYSTFVFQQIEYAPVNPAATEYNKNLNLVKLFWSDSSFAVHETLFIGPDSTGDEQDEFDEESQSPKLQLRNAASHRRRPKAGIDDDENFIVDDWDESAATLPRAGIKKAQPSKEQRRYPSEWTLDMTTIYEAALENILMGTGHGDSKSLQSRPTLGQLAKGVADETLDTLDEWSASQTLLELSRDRPRIEDIDDGAEDLAGLVATALREPGSGAQRRFMILPLHLSKQFHGVLNIPQAEYSRLDYLDTYEQLVTDWVTSLPHGPGGISDQTRVLKEKMLRDITLDLCLARVIRISNIPNPTETPAFTSKSMPPSQSTAMQLLSSQSQLPSSQNQTEPTQIGSSQTAPTQETSDPIKQTGIYSNLAAFTTFREPRRQPRKLTKLLSHWKTGTDPTTYEWTKTNRMIENEESQRMYGSRRPRSKRSRSKSVAPEATSLPPTPVAPIIRASQPTWPTIASSQPLASSQLTIDETPMTQTERGPFGAREIKKKTKKKRRAAGF